MINARNHRFSVYLEPYSLAAGEVGKPVFQPVLVSRHRSANAARHALIRLITGTDSTAQDYLRQAGSGIALRFVARGSDAPFPAYSANDLRGQV